MLQRKRMTRMAKLRTKVKKKSISGKESDTVQMIKEWDTVRQSRENYNLYIIWFVQLKRFLNYQKDEKVDYGNLQSKDQAVLIKVHYLEEM